jgi:hypothetical protein
MGCLYSRFLVAFSVPSYLSPCCNSGYFCEQGLGELVLVMEMHIRTLLLLDDNE